jgi:glutamyl-tRNA synthetase
LSISEQDRSSMEKYALQNAVKHDGKAEVGAVVSKVLGDTPALRTMAKEVARVAAEVVRGVNAMSPQAQLETLKEKYPEAAQAPEKKEGRVGLPPLDGAEKGKLVVRLPPEPSGYMHIGHAMAGTINDVYKQEYDGKLWLRFEDTNPRKVQKRYYESFRKGYSWLGIKWDYEKNVSSDVELLYEHIQDLIEAGSAYACSCAPEVMKKLRFEGDRVRA